MSQRCQKPYTRHRYDGQLSCRRCGCPNPSWKPTRSRKKILVTFRPTRRPKWWPQGDDGRAAWATLQCDYGVVWGYSIGIHPEHAVLPRDVWAAIEEWEDDNDNRTWDFRLITP